MLRDINLGNNILVGGNQPYRSFNSFVEEGPTVKTDKYKTAK